MLDDGMAHNGVLFKSTKMVGFPAASLLAGVSLTQAGSPVLDILNIIILSVNRFCFFLNGSFVLTAELVAGVASLGLKLYYLAPVYNSTKACAFEFAL